MAAVGELTDTLGLLITVAVTPANWQDRDAAPGLVLAARHRGRDQLSHIWAGSACQGDWICWAQHAHGVTTEIVTRPEGTRGFQVLPRRWVIERTHAWITRRRRTARDYERLPSHHAAMVQWAAILQMTRRLAPLSQVQPAL